ncbi:MFS transporter [Amycolatopsis bullii]|uniref:MFS transporter n=2 Tax=Pseudonocardiaceae TaxID=2070 RepID=A0ABQ3JWC4_9PSEU|nr:MFS transporter [Amycolatopsis bullii]
MRATGQLGSVQSSATTPPEELLFETILPYGQISCKLLLMGAGMGRNTVLAAVCAVAVASIYAAQPALAGMGADLAVPAAGLGWIVAAGQLGYLAGLSLLVPLGDLRDRRKLIAAHLVLTAAGAVVAAAATRLWVLLAGLALAGLFAVVVQTTVAYAAASATPAERGRTLGAVTSGVVLGILGARVAAGALATAWGWRSVYVVLAVLLVTLAAVVLKTLPPDPRTGPSTYREVLTSLGKLFRERLFVSRGLIAFFLFASFGTLWSGLALPLAAAPWRLSPAQIGLFGLAGLVGALGAARAGRWADAGFARPVTVGALALLAVSWAAIGPVSWSLWPVIGGVVVLDFAVQAVHVSNQHLLTTAHPDTTSSAIGGYMLFYSLGSALGATATTAAFAVAGWAGSSVLGAGFALCALAAALTGRARPATRCRCAPGRPGRSRRRVRRTTGGRAG